MRFLYIPVCSIVLVRHWPVVEDVPGLVWLSVYLFGGSVSDLFDLHDFDSFCSVVRFEKFCVFFFYLGNCFHIFWLIFCMVSIGVLMIGTENSASISFILFIWRNSCLFSPVLGGFRFRWFWHLFCPRNSFRFGLLLGTFSSFSELVCFCAVFLVRLF